MVAQLQQGDFATKIAEQAAALALERVNQATTARQTAQANAIEELRATSHNGNKSLADPSIVLRTSAGKIDKGELLLDQLNKFLADPLSNLTKAVELWNKVKHPGLDPTNLQKVPIATIRAIAAQSPDEFAFVAQQVIPDPMNDLIPQLTAEAYKRGFGSVVEANRWAREYVRDLSLAERRSPTFSTTGIPTDPLPKPTVVSRPASNAPQEPKPAVMRAPKLLPLKEFQVLL